MIYKGKNVLSMEARLVKARKKRERKENRIRLRAHRELLEQSSIKAQKMSGMTDIEKIKAILG